MENNQVIKKKRIIQQEDSIESSFDVVKKPDISAETEDIDTQIVENKISENTITDAKNDVKKELVEVSLPPITLSSTKEEIMERVNTTDDIEELKNLANLFGVSLTKKELARVSKESDLLDKLLENAELRITSKSDYLSNDELIDYLKTFQGNVDKSRKTLTDDLDNATTKITHNEININVNQSSELDSLSRDSRENIMNFLSTIMNNKGKIQEPEEIQILEEDKND